MVGPTLTRTSGLYRCQEVAVEEVLTATLPKQSAVESLSTNEELDPLLASPGKKGKKKGVQSYDS